MGNGMAGGERKVKTYVGEAGKSASVCFYTGGGWKAGEKVIIKAVKTVHAGDGGHCEATAGEGIRQGPRERCRESEVRERKPTGSDSAPHRHDSQ